MITLQTLLSAPLLTALLARLLARYTKLSAAVGAAASGGLWLWLGNVEPAGTVVVLWGQPMALMQDNYSLLRALFLGLFILFGLAVFLPSGDWFVPGSLAGSAFLAGALLVRPFPVALALILVAAGAFTLTVQSGEAGSVKGSLRYLLATVLAVLLLLIVAWQMDAQTAEWLPDPGQLTALALLLLLAGFPFHVWVLAVANEARPLPLVLVTGLAPLIPLALLLQYLAIHPNLLNASFRQLIWLSGSLTLLVAGVLALTAVRLRRFIGSILLLNMSFTVLSLTLSEQTAWEAASALQVGRFGSLLLLASGWELMQRNQISFSADRLPSVRLAPLSAMLLGLGIFSLLGLPFTLGFAGHWRLLTALAALANLGGVPWWLPAMALLSLGLGAAGALRLLTKGDDNSETTASEPRWVRVAGGVVLIIFFWLALSPQTILSILVPS